MAKLKGFSFFCGAGGSTIGYKKAGLDVIGGCDVDKKQLEIYKREHNPKYFLEIDCREVLKKDYEFLYNLDFIDGSPPCTNFSRVNIKRKNKQFKEKKYAEGAIVQTLEDLILIYFKIVVKYQPKFFIFENVANLNQQYKSYLLKCLYDSNIENYYSIVKFYLDPYDLGGYTTRKRFFILGIKKNINFKITSYLPVHNSLVDVKHLISTLETNANYQIKIWNILKNNIAHYDSFLVDFKNPIPVITTKIRFFNFEKPYAISPKSLAFIQGFGDYNWNQISNSRIMYAIGMSVHPLCTEYIGNILINFDKTKEIPVLLNDNKNLELL